MNYQNNKNILFYARKIDLGLLLLSSLERNRMVIELEGFSQNDHEHLPV